MEWTTLPRWITWKYKEVYDSDTGLMKRTKVPFTTKMISYKDQSFWLTFEKAQAQSKAFNLDGIGFVLGGKYQAFDLDNCQNDPRTAELLSMLNTYTEVSPSGKGRHFLFLGPETLNKNRKLQGCEFHVNGWITVTGDQPEGEIGILSEETITSVLQKYEKPVLPAPAQVPAPAPVPAVTGKKVVLTDDQIFNLCSINPRFERLWNNNNGDYKSPSEGDQAFANFIKKYTDDTSQIERIMKSSPRNREKFNRQDYMDTTIQKAADRVGPAVPVTDQKFEDRHLPPFPRPSGFFGEYYDYEVSRTWAAPEFNFGALLAIVSPMFRRIVCMQTANTSIYPNIYVMLAGISGGSGKTTSCDHARRYWINASDPYILPLEGKITSPQAIVQAMETNQTALWYYNECNPFFDDITQPWTAGIIGLMCDLWDSPAVKQYRLTEKQKGKNFYQVIDPNLTVLWNTTTSEIERNIIWRYFSNGWAPRFLWFINDQPGKRRANPRRTTEDLMLQREFASKIEEVKALLDKFPGNDRIIFYPSPRIEEWVNRKIEDYPSDDPESFNTTMARVYGNSYKIALILSLFDPAIQQTVRETSISPLYLNFPEDVLTYVIKLFDEYLIPRTMLIAEICELNTNKSKQSIILKILKKCHGHASRTKLLRASHLYSRQLNDVLDSMQEAGMVAVSGDPTGGRDAIQYSLL